MKVANQAVRLRKHDVDTVTLAGYMTNNCILASAAVELDPQT